MCRIHEKSTNKVFWTQGEGGFESTHGLLMPLSVTPKEKVTKTLDSMLSLGANVNIYMMHGGTSFGFKAGANADPKYEPNPTSYDYDAPIRNMIWFYANK